MKKIKYAAIPSTMGQLGDRFMGEGYKENGGMSFEAILASLKELDLIDAVELSYSGEGKEADPVYIKEQLDGFGLEASVVFPTLHCQRKWKNGTLSSADPEIRKQAVQFSKDTLDFAKAIGAPCVSLWIGQDGFDYAFQTDYIKQWNNLIESIQEIADYMPDMRLALEPKLREPRGRSLIDTTQTALLMSLEAGRDNIGVTIDVGHVLQAGMNVSQNMEIVNKYGKMYNFHVNDNYGTWDDDMIFGSVRFLESLEMFYTLNKIGYDKYLSVDIFPYRDRSIEATRECLLYMRKFQEMVDKIGMERLEQLISANDITEVLAVVRKELL